MRHVWIDAGNQPDAAKLSPHGIYTVLFPANDPQTTEALLDKWRGQYKVGLYLARNWYNTDAESMARIASQEVTRVGGDAEQCFVHLNPEPFDAAYISALLTAYRALRPNRQTWLVHEWNKGALYTPALLTQVNNDAHLIVVEEAFDGDMTPHDPDEARSNLVSYGIQRGKAVPCYDAARLGSYWDGVAFTQGRLT